jgi:hypothetical protein
MSETLLTDIEATIKSFEHTLEATRTGRRDHVGASADLRAVGPSVRAGEGARRLISPFLTGLATIGAVVWTFWYAHRVRARLEALGA